VSLLHDERILGEYRSVLARPRFGFDQGDVRIVLEQVERRGERVLAPPLPITLPDPDDLPFLEVAAAGRADALVTGNARHFEPSKGTHAVPVISPAEAVRRLGGGS
jgi:uncharacterized protein